MEIVSNLVEKRELIHRVRQLVARVLSARACARACVCACTCACACTFETRCGSRRLSSQFRITAPGGTKAPAKSSPAAAASAEHGGREGKGVAAALVPVVGPAVTLLSPAEVLARAAAAGAGRGGGKGASSMEDEFQVLRTTLRNYSGAIARLGTALVTYVDNDYGGTPAGITLATFPID